MADKNVNKQKNYLMPSILAVLGMAVLYGLALVWMYWALSKTFIDNSTKAQKAICDQLAGGLTQLENAGADDEALIDYIKDTVTISGNSWPFLIKGDTVIFAQDKYRTEALKNNNGRSDFVAALEAQDQILSMSDFGEDESYTVGIISSKGSESMAVGTQAPIVFMVIIWASLIAFSAMGILYLAGCLNRTAKELGDMKEDLRLRNAEFETYKNKSDEYFSTSVLTPSGSERSSRFKQYAFKFYINARHAIYIDGKLGTMHPHTWELKLYVVKVSNDFIQFDRIEKEIEEFIAPFQDKELNSVEPFNVLNPTLENCCNYFKDQISAILKDRGWLLMMMEMSETPSRSYVVNMIANDT